jgi:hypothetical protein
MTMIKRSTNRISPVIVAELLTQPISAAVVNIDANQEFSIIVND